MITLPDKHKVLVVDDEPDIHALTRLTLKKMRYRDRRVKIINASSGLEAVELMKEHPDIGVILLDVVMESSTAGLDACKAIREELGNHFVRIILRTGQPGVAPEKQVIDEYDIDGYLPKAELTTTRLYTTIRTALKSFEELVELQRYHEILSFIHNAASDFHSFEPLEQTLHRILETTVVVAPSPMAVLNLETFEEKGNPRQYLIHISTEPDAIEAEAAAVRIVSQVAADPSALSLTEAGPFGEGYLIPLELHHELGHGWIYLENELEDPLLTHVLPMLSSHASNALYSTVARLILEAREGAFYESIIV